MRPQKGKQKIFDSAMTLFAQQGYFATTIAQITKHAGVSKGLVYNYFSSKEELLVGLFEDATATIQMHVEILASGKKIEDSVTQFIESFFSFWVREQEFLRLQLTLMLTPELNEILKGTVKKRAESSLEFVTDWLIQLEVSEAEQKARLVLAQLDGISLHYLSIFEDYPLDSMKGAVRKSLLKLSIS